MRGLALYENGRRPFFEISPGSFCDKDNFEYNSYHILARTKKNIVGCLRLLPLASDINCISAEIIGPDLFKMILNENKISQKKITEANRWIVHPSYKHTRIGYYLVYGCWALCQHLGYRFIANAGLKAQKLIDHYGGVLLSSQAGPYYSEKYQDSVYMFQFEFERLSKRARTYIAEMGSRLQLMRYEVSTMPDNACLL